MKVGDAVKEDEELVILEAMKMENPIVAPSNGTVKEIKVKEGTRSTRARSSSFWDSGLKALPSLLQGGG